MKKTERQITACLPLIDAVAEIVDARIPQSSRNPSLDKLLGGKPRLLLMNKCDIADKAATDKWISYYRANGVIAVPVDCKTGKGTDGFVKAVKLLLADKLRSYDEKGTCRETAACYGGRYTECRKVIVHQLYVAPFKGQGG